MSRSAEMKLITVALLAALVVVGGVIFSTRRPTGGGVPPAGPDTTVDRAALVLPGSRARGASQARCTLVEFADLQCPNTLFARGKIRQYERAHPGQMRHVTYHMQTSPVHAHQPLLARATEAAAAQGRFWEMRDALLDRQGRFETMSPAQARHAVQRLARALKLDMAAFLKMLDSPETERRYQQDAAMAERLGFRGTPGYYFLPPSGAPIRLNNISQLMTWLEEPRHWR